MKKLPQIILDEFQKRTGAPVVTTTSKDGITNSIYATCVAIYNEEKVLIANNKFSKTLKNIENGCKGNFLFITEDRKAYQLKGTYAYYTEGEYFDDMKKWNRPDLAGDGVAVLTVDNVYQGAEVIEC